MFMLFSLLVVSVIGGVIITLFNKPIRKIGKKADSFLEESFKEKESEEKKNEYRL